MFLLNLQKPQRFLITSLLLSLGFVGIHLVENPYRYLSIGILSLLTLILFAWSLREGLGLDTTLLSLVLPTLFTLGVGIFWFLLPVSIYTRIPTIIFYGSGIYVLSRTSNIFTVSAIRTIPLLRVARGVGFVLTLVTSFLLFDAISSLREAVYITVPLVLVVSFPLIVQGLWVVQLEKDFSKENLLMAGFFSLVLGEITASLYFWPVTVVVGSLFLTVTVYMLLGLGQAFVEGRLFVQTVREYLVVGILVFLGMFLATRWG